MKKSNLVITGMGAVTPIGIGTQEYWRNLVAGVCGVKAITRFDASNLPVRIAAEVGNFNVAELLPSRMISTSSLFMQFAIVAAEEAFAQSGLVSCKNLERVGIVMGTALGGVATVASTEEHFAQSKTKKVSPYFVPSMIGNMAAGHFAIERGVKGPCLTLNTACSAGGDAMMTAAMLLNSGEVDAMIVMGGESILTPSVLSSLAQAKALSRCNDRPAQASRPFDRDRDGFVIGEGGGALVIETEASAQARGAEILAGFAGYANTMDAHHITAPHPEGEGASRCMLKALERAGLQAKDIDYINAHGTSTMLGDRAETLAIKRIFGGVDSAPPVSSTKGATGHLMGAGGITEVIACIMAIRENIIPPTLNLDNADPQCDLDYVPNRPREAKVNVAMSNSLGFGGQNSSILVARYAA